MDEDTKVTLNNTDLLVPGEEGLRDIYVAVAIYKSAAQNCVAILKFVSHLK